MYDPESREAGDATPAPAGPGPGRAGPVAELLERVERFVGRFVRFSNEHQGVAVALWVAHVYVVQAAPFAPYLRITSAVEECGKSTLIELLALLLGEERCLDGVSVTPAAVFRYREKVGPVALLLDEIDQTLRDRKDDGARDLLALVNAGYRRSARVLRTVGRSHEPKAFQAFGPCAIAGLGTLHPTTESRCIPIVLERKPRASGERFLAHLAEPEAREIARDLAAWATAETIERLRAAQPELPISLRDRHAEMWWILFAIADEAGGRWPERARRAALALHSAREGPDTMSIGVLLLAHVRQAFEEAGADRLATVDLLRRLVENEEGPWGRFWGAELARDGTPRAAPADLARYLRQFRTPEGEPIRPRVIKMADGSTARGYRLEDLAAAFELYLPTAPSGDVTPPTDVTALASEVTSATSVTGDPRTGAAIEAAGDRGDEPGCVRCRRYGPGHRGPHVSSWEEVGRG
ncbi:MAG: hypothetical protein KatS3mg013_1216 [Actinomycetota bacterium]|nr:MAG: hypothetical protein KatS3mg013_1216 [Actinomycetota bacterium]